MVYNENTNSYFDADSLHVYAHVGDTTYGDRHYFLLENEEIVGFFRNFYDAEYPDFCCGTAHSGSANYSDKARAEAYANAFDELNSSDYNAIEELNQRLFYALAEDVQVEETEYGYRAKIPSLGATHNISHEDMQRGIDDGTFADAYDEYAWLADMEADNLNPKFIAGGITKSNFENALEYCSKVGIETDDLFLMSVDNDCTEDLTTSITNILLITNKDFQDWVKNNEDKIPDELKTFDGNGKMIVPTLANASKELKDFVVEYTNEVLTAFREDNVFAMEMYDKDGYEIAVDKEDKNIYGVDAVEARVEALKDFIKEDLGVYDDLEECIANNPEVFEKNGRSQKSQGKEL